MRRNRDNLLMQSCMYNFSSQKQVGIGGIEIEIQSVQLKENSVGVQSLKTTPHVTLSHCQLEINSSSIPSTKKTFREAVIRGKTIRCYRVATSKDQSNEPQSFP